MMNTIKLRQLGHSIIVVLIMWLTAGYAPVYADELALLDTETTWQNNRLFAPTVHQRAQEQKGSVVIYDGLKDITVEDAMDQAFDRIQNMMFTRIIRTGKSGQPVRDKDGDVVVEDDGC
jgi:hypothetical protein